MDVLDPVITAATQPNVQKGLQAIALGVGAGLGTIGPGIGVGFIFGKVIESVTRQPEMRDEITSIQWLGFALTEAIIFYAFIFGLIVGSLVSSLVSPQCYRTNRTIFFPHFDSTPYLQYPRCKSLPKLSASRPTISLPKMARP